MRRSRRLFVLIATLVLGTPAAVLAAPDPLEVRDSSFQIASPTGGDAIPALRVRFPRAVIDAAYDDSSQILVVQLEKQKISLSHSIVQAEGFEFNNLIVAYHTTRREVLWQRWNPRQLVCAAGGVVVLSKDNSVEVWDQTTSSLLMTWSGRAHLLVPTRQLLRIENGHVQALSLPELVTDWETDVEGPAKRIEVYSDGPQVFLLGDALTTVDLMTGQSWQLDASLRRRTPLGARFTIGRYEVTRLGSLPVRSGGDLFFAADSEAMRIHSHNGMSRWRRAMDFDPREKERRRAMGLYVPPVRSPGMMTIAPMGREVAVVGSGMLWFNDAPAFADPPAIAMLDAETGRWRRGARLDTTKVVVSYLNLREQHYFLGDGERVTRYDSLLVPQAVWRPERIDRPLRSLQRSPGDRLWVMAAAHLIELDPLTLQERGRVRTGIGLGRMGREGWYAGAEALVRLNAGGVQTYPRRANSWRPVGGIETSCLGHDALILHYNEDDAPLFEP